MDEDWLGECEFYAEPTIGWHYFEADSELWYESYIYYSWYIEVNGNFQCYGNSIKIELTETSTTIAFVYITYSK